MRHYSKYKLNTYATTPYFAAHAPSDYLIDKILIKSRAFRRLPPALRRLSGLAKQWAMKQNPDYPAGIAGIEEYYDDEGYELDPRTNQRMTDEEIDANWDSWGDLGLGDFEVRDVPEPEGGFADPDTWQEPAAAPDEDPDEDGIKEDRILKDIRSHGRDYVARYYGVEEAAGSDDQLAKQAAAAVRARRGVYRPAPESPRPSGADSDSN